MFAETGVHSWIRVPALSRSWHFRNESMRERKFCTVDSSLTLTSPPPANTGNLTVSN